MCRDQQPISRGPIGDRSGGRHDGRRVVVGRSLLSGLVRAVAVVVSGEFAKD
jgi:hypothetical protein